MSSFGKSIVSLIGKTGGAMAEPVLRTIAIATILSLCTLAPAQAATFHLSWMGQILGYSAEGQFSYDDAQTYENGIVRGNDLEAFDIAFYDPQGSLIQAFEDNHLTYSGFNFNFDTQTGEILQDGFFDEPKGIDIGEYTVLFDEAGEPVGATGLNFWSAAPAPDGEPIPHVHLTDFGNEFPDLPIGFGSHLDVAFFTRTQAQLLDDPGAGDQLGQRMIATQVPEPAAFSWAGCDLTAGSAFTPNLICHSLRPDNCKKLVETRLGMLRAERNKICKVYASK